MYVILANKPGQFRTEIGDGLHAVETYDYLFCGRKRASYVIAELQREVKVRIVDESDAPVVNEVPSKFLPRYPNLEAAQHALAELMTSRELDIKLVKV